MKKDVFVLFEKSNPLFLLFTPGAKEWVKKNVGENALYSHENLLVKPEYVDELVDHMRADGLVVSR